MRSRSTSSTSLRRSRAFEDTDADDLFALQSNARVLEKLGFVREGTLREDCVVGGDVSDSWTGCSGENGGRLRRHSVRA